jgi:hypothetical protein
MLQRNPGFNPAGRGLLAGENHFVHASLSGTEGALECERIEH